MNDIVIGGKTWRPVAWRQPKRGEWLLKGCVVAKALASLSQEYLILEYVKPKSPLKDWASVGYKHEMKLWADERIIVRNTHTRESISLVSAEVERICELWQRHKEATRNV